MGERIYHNISKYENYFEEDDLLFCRRSKCYESSYWHKNEVQNQTKRKTNQI